MKEGYIYIGEYYHRHGKEINLSEKKIGLTINLDEREKSLNSTKYTIGYIISEAWKVDNMNKVEKSIHSLLAHDRLSGEWFDDVDDTLKQRVEKFMEINGYEKVNLSTNETENEDNRTRAKLDRSHRQIQFILNEKFKYRRNDKTFHIKVLSEDKIEVVEDGTFHGSMNKACVHGIEKICYGGNTNGKTTTLNIWSSLQTSEGKTPDEICKEKFSQTKN